MNTSRRSLLLLIPSVLFAYESIADPAYLQKQVRETKKGFADIVQLTRDIKDLNSQNSCNFFPTQQGDFYSVKSPSCAIDIALNRYNMRLSNFDSLLPLDDLITTVYPDISELKLSTIKDLHAHYQQNPCMYFDTNFDGLPEGSQWLDEERSIVYSLHRSEQAVRHIRQKNVRENLLASYKHEVANARLLYPVLLAAANVCTNYTSNQMRKVILNEQLSKIC